MGDLNHGGFTQKLALLKKYFGYSSFREGQETVVDALLEGRDVLAVMPTGAGKSLCFQLPALAFDGITLVISPLISLMKDQVTGLVQSGVPAAFFNSSLTERQYALAMDYALQGKYKIIYVAPERLATPQFALFAQQMKISMVTIDEAHCISQWGADFRPSYLKIPAFIATLSHRPPVSAFTATATIQVREDIDAALGLQAPLSIVTGFDRENLYYEVQKPADKLASLLEVLQKHRDQSGIVYCSTRKAVEEVTAFLNEQGFAAAPYHAGLSAEARSQNQNDFLYDRKPVMVATNAFGMGIDKSNVRYVVHYNMPKDLESYYQEAGRAGRDGMPADCVLLYGGRDVSLNEYLIKLPQSNPQPSPQPDTEVAQALFTEDLNRLRRMTFYCHTTSCLRQYVLRYFGETAPSYCGNCFNCLHHFEEQDITADARNIIRCVQQSGQRFGISMTIDLLRGAKTERLLRLRLNEQSTYGSLKALAVRELRDRIQYLVECGYLALSIGEYPVLTLAGEAREVLSGDRQLSMKLAEKSAPATEKKRSAKRTAEESGGDRQLFEQLRTLRMKIAKEEQVPAFIVFSDSTLWDICAKHPTTLDEMLTVSGIGQMKCEKYGERFLEAILTG